MPIRRAAALVRHLFPLLLLWFVSAAAPAAASSWALTSFGTAGADAAIKVMTRDTDGNLYVAGTFSGATMTVGSLTLRRSQAPVDIFVAKLGPYGSPAWAQSFGSETASFDPTVSAIAVDSAGKVYLAGSFGGSFSDLSSDAQDGRYGFVLRTTESNWVEWSSILSGTSVDLFDMAVDASQDAVFVAGQFNQGQLNNPVLPLTGTGDGFVARLRAVDGTAVWGKAIAGAGATAKVRNLALDANGQTIYFAGGFYNADLTIPPLSKIGEADTAVFRLDYGGSNLTVIQSIGGPSANVSPLALSRDDAAGLYLVGSFAGRITNPQAASLSGLGDDPAGYAIKLATDGTIAWANQFGGSRADFVVRAAAVSGSRLYVTGSFSGGDIDTPPAAALSRIGSSDGFMLALAQDGRVAEARGYGGAGASLSINALLVNDQGVYLAGEFSDGALINPSVNLIGISQAVIVADAPPRPTLTIAAPSNGSVRDGGGDLACGTACSMSYAPGATVTLTATAAAGFTFAGWTGDCGGTDNPLTLTMNASKACAASFAAVSPGGGGNTPAPAGPTVPAAPPAFVTSPVPTTLDAATVGTGSGSVSFAAAFTNPAALSFSAAAASNTPLPAWLTFDPASVSFSYNVPLPPDLPIQPIADADADTRAARTDARATWANTIYPPLIRVAQIPVTLTASGAGQSYASTIRMSFYAPRPRVAVAAISLSQGGAIGNARSSRPALSFDAAQAVFQTDATNIFPAAANADTDIVRYHALSGTRDRLSQTAIPGGGVANPANGQSINPAVSPDGRFAAFASDAPAITLTPPGRFRQVYRTSLAHPRRDLDPAGTPAPDFVSTNPDGIPGNAPSDKPALSEDGRYVVFESAATNFTQALAEPLDSIRQVWRKDLATGAIAIVSAAASPGNAPSGNPAISWNGRYIAFESAATNLTANPGSGTQVYLKDMSTGAVRLVSAAAGTPANAPATTPVLSARADKLAFVSAATNLGIPNPAARNQVLIVDLATAGITLVAPDADQPAISADGRFVAFRTANAGFTQIWVRDTARGATALVTQTADGNPGNGSSWAPAISGDATTIAFASDARDLVNGNPAPGQAYLAANPLLLPQKTAYWALPAIGGGQGWLTERWGDRAYVAALAYDQNGRATWLAGFCTLTDLACRGNLQGWTGGTPFGLAAPASPLPTAGTTFAITADPAGNGATLALPGTSPQPLAVHAIGGSARTGYAGLPQPGWWYEPEAAASANGYFLAVHSQPAANGAVQQVAYLSILTFDPAGLPVWYAAQATLATDLGFSAILYQYQGGAALGAATPAGGASAIPIGQVRMAFDATDRAAITLPNGRKAIITRFRF